MSPMAIGWIVFALVFGSALLAMFLHSVLPEEHLSSDSKDVVKLGIALIATMSALVLSLLIASAKSAFDTRSNQLVEASADMILLDRALDRYGPETKEARSLLRRSVAATIERFWPADGAKPIAIDPAASPVEALYDKIEALSPQSDLQRSMQSQNTSTTRNGIGIEVPRCSNSNRRVRATVPANVRAWLCIERCRSLCGDSASILS